MRACRDGLSLSRFAGAIDTRRWRVGSGPLSPREAARLVFHRRDATRTFCESGCRRRRIRRWGGAVVAPVPSSLVTEIGGYAALDGPVPRLRRRGRRGARAGLRRVQHAVPRALREAALRRASARRLDLQAVRRPPPPDSQAQGGGGVRVGRHTERRRRTSHTHSLQHTMRKKLYKWV